MNNSGEASSSEIDTLQKTVEELKAAIQSGDCAQMNAKIKSVLNSAKPVQNLIQVGKVQESDEKISNLKAEIRVATGEIQQKCPNKNTKTNNVKTNNVKTNNVKTNNVKTNNVKTNNVKTNNVKTNNVKTNNVKTNNTSEAITNTTQTGGKRRTRKNRKY